MEFRSEKLNKSDSAWFFFIFLYLFIDYGRPQDILPIIGFLRPGIISVLILTWYIISSGNFRLSDSKQTRLILCFICLTAIFIPFARNNYFAYMTTKGMLLFMPFVISTIIVVNSIDRLRKLISFIIAIMVYICVFSLLHQGKGSGNYFHDENDVTLFINMWLPFCYFLFLYEKTKIKKIAYGISMIIGVLTVVVSFSRGGFVGLVCMMAIVWWFSPRKIVSLAIICLLGSIMYIYGGESYRSEMSTVTDTHEATAHGRIMTWEAAWKMFLDNPWGVGGNNFQARFPEYQSSEFKKGMWGRVAHSLWFTLIPELGLAGIFIYMSLLYHNLKDIIFFLRGINTDDNPDLRYLHFLSLAFIASFTGFFVSATFLSVLYYPHYWYITGILVATIKIANSIKHEETLEIKSSNNA